VNLRTSAVVNKFSFRIVGSCLMPMHAAVERNDL
jgi:hypothetical protein